MNTINYLRYHRKRWALTQTQAAHLLGLGSRSSFSDYESDRTAPSFHTAIGLELVFGEPLRNLFPRLTAEVHDEVLRRAADLDAAHRDRADATAEKIRELLSAMIKRADSSLGA